MPTVGGLFDGIGLLAYGLHLAGWQHTWLCEVDPWRRQVLGRRWPGVRVFDDVRAVGARTAEPVTLLAGGFPCKGGSTAGKRNGFEHPETRLWREMARAMRELRPRYVLLENVANLLAIHDGAVWGEVLGDLAACGLDAEWDCVPAAAVGAPHLRDRVFCVAAHPDAWRRGAGTGLAPWLSRHGQPEPAGSGQPPPDADRDGVRQQPEPQPRRSGEAISAGPAEAAAHTSSTGRKPTERARQPRGVGRDARAERGVPVEWGQYEAAVGRWEDFHGPAPEPLVRRVDDGRTVGMERSRLSALGDGVQVQIGWLVGAYILDLEAERVRAAA